MEIARLMVKNLEFTVVDPRGNEAVIRPMGEVRLEGIHPVPAEIPLIWDKNQVTHQLLAYRFELMFLVSEQGMIYTVTPMEQHDWDELSNCTKCGKAFVGWEPAKDIANCPGKRP